VEDRGDLLRAAEVEAEHFDEFYSKADEQARLRNYIIPAEFIEKVQSRRKFKVDEYEYAYSLLGDLRDKKLLDYGAGDGWHAVCLAKAKARVWAIDISKASIALTTATAAANGVGDSVVAEVRNAYATEFPDSQFDLVYGGGILHHLDVEEAGNEIRRVLKPGGTAVFFEPLSESKVMESLVRLARRLLGRVPSAETENEGPLTVQKIKQLKSSFGVLNLKFFRVASSANKLIRSRGIRRSLLWIDYLFMRILPGYSRLARVVVIELRHPIK